MTLSDLEWLSKVFSNTKRCAVSLQQLSFLFSLIIQLIVGWVSGMASSLQNYSKLFMRLLANSGTSGNSCLSSMQVCVYTADCLSARKLYRTRSTPCIGSTRTSKTIVCGWRRLTWFWVATVNWCLTPAAWIPVSASRSLTPWRSVTILFCCHPERQFI